MIHQGIRTILSGSGPRKAGGFTMVTALLLITATVTAQTTWPADASPDDIAWREQVRAYGLGEWLDAQNAAQESANDIDTLLQQRETLLYEAEDPSLASEVRRAKIDEAIAVLDHLLETHGDHVDAVSWRIRAAEDRLYHADPRALRRLLLYELPGPDHKEAEALSRQAVKRLQTASETIDRRWEHVAGLNEGELSWLKRTGVIGQLERHDRRCRDLMIWAKLYAALSMRDDDPSERRAYLQEVLAQLEPLLAENGVAVPPAEKAQALLAAAISARLLGRHEEGLRHARAFIDVYRGMTDAEVRQRVRWALLPAALERVRAERDAGHAEEALNMVLTMKESAAETLEDDVEMAWALALLEHGLLLRSGSGGPAPPDDFSLAALPALFPLEEAAELSLRHLDFMYRLFSVAAHDQPVHDGLAPFARQLLAGAAQSQFMAGRDEPDELIRSRVADTMKLLSDDAIASARLDSAKEGEWLFLRGRGLYLLGQAEEAIRVLRRMAEAAPDHERAPFALEQAAILAHQQLIASQGEHVEQARQEFIRTAQLLRDLATRRPDVKISGQMRFLMALALEESDRLAEAAAMYAEIAPDDPHALAAGQRRVHCRLRLLERARLRESDQASSLRELARESLQAAREAHRLARERLDNDGLDEKTLCEAAGSILLYAHAANLPEIRLPNDVLAILVDFDTRFTPCTEARREAMSERITAWVALERWADARRALQEKAQQGDPQAGPAMAQLLERMRAVILEAMGRGAEDTVRSTARQAAVLADDLLAWGREHPDAMSDADLETVRAWRAWALLQAGQLTDALEAFAACNPSPASESGEVSALKLEVRLGRAECLLQMGQADQALPDFTAIWQRLPEHSDYWWRAYTGSLAAHLAIGSDPHGILQSLRQQRHLAPELGGPVWKRRLEHLEHEALALSDTPATLPSP